jgi:hypothetical protein
MATYADEWYILETNIETGLVTGLYTVGNVVQKYTTEASALAALQDYKGENEAKLTRVQAVTWSVTAT